LRRFVLAAISLFVFAFAAGGVLASEQVFTGKLDSNNPTFTTTFELRTGESVLIAANATSGDLDTFLTLTTADGVVVAENDDRDFLRLDAAVGYTAIKDGSYTLTLSRYDDSSSGTYELKIHVGDVSLLDELDTQPGEVQLSGEVHTIDTPHFRIHYTLEGKDRTTENYAREVAKTMEAVWQTEIHDLGWPMPPDDGRGGGDDRFDVYLLDMLDRDGYGPLGSARPGAQYGDNPNTSVVERYATSTMIRLDNDFAELEAMGEDVLDLLRATAAHEFHHAIQHGYDPDDLLWYYETTAVWIETQVFPKSQDATGYIEYTFEYPELCFGTEDDPDGGLLMYGEWLFIQSLIDAHGEKALYKLWSNIAVYDGFESLEQTLAFYGETIPDALARYRIQNLVRDYALALQFEGDSVWLSADINRPGRLVGDGMQELGANYIAFRPTPGTYRVSLEGDEELELWAIGIIGEDADVMALGRGGVISNSGYDEMYLMVFNPAYNEDSEDCTYADYTIQTAPGNGTPVPVHSTWDAKYFAPPTRD
jgi:hypothetical protein